MALNGAAVLGGYSGLWSHCVCTHEMPSVLGTQGASDSYLNSAYTKANVLTCRQLIQLRYKHSITADQSY